MLQQHFEGWMEEEEVWPARDHSMKQIESCTAIHWDIYGEGERERDRQRVNGHERETRRERSDL
jgi:hypothetical protein